MHSISKNYCEHTAFSGRNGGLVKKKNYGWDERTLLVMFTGVLQYRSCGAPGHRTVQTDFSQKGCFLSFQLFIFYQGYIFEGVCSLVGCWTAVSQGFPSGIKHRALLYQCGMQ